MIYKKTHARLKIFVSLVFYCLSASLFVDITGIVLYNIYVWFELKI